MPQLVNWTLLKEPLNWIIVALMLAIAVYTLTLLFGDKPEAIAATGSAGL